MPVARVSNMPRKKSVEDQFRQERESGWDSTTSNFSLGEYNALTDRVRVLPASLRAAAAPVMQEPCHRGHLA